MRWTIGLFIFALAALPEFAAAQEYQRPPSIDEKIRRIHERNTERLRELRGEAEAVSRDPNERLAQSLGHPPAEEPELFRPADPNAWNQGSTNPFERQASQPLEPEPQGAGAAR